MDCHSEANVQRPAMQAIANMCDDDSSNAAQAVLLKLPEKIIQAMVRHPAAPEVQEQALGAIASITARSPASREEA
eukprot:scaffold445507_cov37-Prasinocladus_malaysianus.AAC.1